MRLVLALLLLCLFIDRINIRIETNFRNPASNEREALDNIKKACESSKEEDTSYVLCEPYQSAKKKLEKQADEYLEVIKDNVPDSVSAVSGFVLKSLYEKRVQLEVKTILGTPSVSISGNQTDIFWKYNYSF